MNPYRAYNIWEMENGKDIALVTPEEFERLPDGTELVSINGRRAIKGKDYIDNDTRMGHLAYGLELDE